MKRLSAILAIFVMAVTAFSFSPVSANGQLDQILANMQAAAKKVSTMRCNLTQSKRLSIGGNETYQGQMIFKHEGQADKFRINYDNGNQVSVDIKEAVLYQPAINQAIIISRGKLASENEELAFFSTPYKLTSSQIKQKYEIAHTGDEGNTAVLQLKPKGNSTVKRMKWWVDKSLWLPTRIEIAESSGDTSIFILANLELNTKLSDNDFKIKFKAGTQVTRK